MRLLGIIIIVCWVVGYHNQALAQQQYQPSCAAPRIMGLQESFHDSDLVVAVSVDDASPTQTYPQTVYIHRVIKGDTAQAGDKLHLADFPATPCGQNNYRLAAGQYYLLFLRNVQGQFYRVGSEYYMPPDVILVSGDSTQRFIKLDLNNPDNSFETWIAEAVNKAESPEQINAARQAQEESDRLAAEQQAYVDAAQQAFANQNQGYVPYPQPMYYVPLPAYPVPSQ